MTQEYLLVVLATFANSEGECLPSQGLLAEILGVKQGTICTNLKVLEKEHFIAATSDKNIERLAHLADGAAYPTVRPDVVTQLLPSIPPEAVIEAFNKLALPLFLQKYCNLEHLNHLRDTVLPKLLSGELTLPDTTPTKANPPESDMLNAGSIPAQVII